MKILIDNGAYELLNYGDIAMLQITIARFEKLFPDAEIHVFTTSPQNLKGYCPNAIPVASDLTLSGRLNWMMNWNVFGFLHRLLPGFLKHRLAVLEFKLISSYPDWVRLWVNWRLGRKNFNTESMSLALELIKSADLVIGSGGGYITDAFDLHARRLLMTLAIAHAYGKPTALFGQGLGPFKKPFLLDIARYCLPKIDLICLREPTEGLSLLKQFNVQDQKLKVTGDDAIELAYQNQPAHIGQDIGINLRIAHYSELNDDSSGLLKPILAQAKEKYRAKIRAIPISRHEGENDGVSLKRVFGELIDTDSEQLSSPLDVIMEVSLCKVVVTGSYHAAVFALSQGASAVCLVSSKYYIHKFQGLAQQFGCGCYIVLMHDENFPAEFQGALDEAWEKADSIRETLLNAAQRQVLASKAAYEDFAKKYK